MRRKYRTVRHTDAENNRNRRQYADRFYKGRNRNAPDEYEHERERTYRSHYENPLEAEDYYGYARENDGVWNLKYGKSHGRGQYEKGHHGNDHPYGGRITHSEFGHQGNRGYHDQDIFEEHDLYEDRYADYDRNEDRDYGFDEFQDEYEDHRTRPYRTEGYAEYDDRYYARNRRREPEYSGSNYEETQRNDHDQRRRGPLTRSGRKSYR